MIQRAKLEARIRNNIHDVTFEDLAGLLMWYGFTRRETGSSHVYFKHPFLPERLSIPRHGAKVKPVYVRHALRLIDQLREDGDA